MKQRLLRFCVLALCVCLLCAPLSVRAENCFTVDVDTLDFDNLTSDDYISRHLTSNAQGVRVRKRVSDSSETAVYVRLTLTQMNTRTLLFDKEYGYVSGTFDSGAIYLPSGGSSVTPYLITLYVGDVGYGLPFMQTQPRQSGSACTVGVRLRDLGVSAGGDWMMGTMLDLDALRRTGGGSLELCVGNSYIIGTAYVTLSGDSLCVDVTFLSSANVELEQYSLYAATDCADFSSAPAYRLGQWVDVTGASSAMLYLPMQLSYDAAQFSAFYYDRSAVQDQIALWNANCSGESNHADSWDAPSGGDWDSGWNGNESDDWNSAWDDPDYGWDDNWSSEASGWQG